MYQDAMYPITQKEVDHLETQGTRGIYPLLADNGANPQKFDKAGLTMQAIIKDTHGRCYRDLWELYKDEKGNYWLRHLECDSSD